MRPILKLQSSSQLLHLYSVPVKVDTARNLRRFSPDEHVAFALLSPVRS